MCAGDRGARDLGRRHQQSPSRASGGLHIPSRGLDPLGKSTCPRLGSWDAVPRGSWPVHVPSEPLWCGGRGAAQLRGTLGPPTAEWRCHVAQLGRGVGPLTCLTGVGLGKGPGVQEGVHSGDALSQRAHGQSCPLQPPEARGKVPTQQVGSVVLHGTQSTSPSEPPAGPWFPRTSLWVQLVRGVMAASLATWVNSPLAA